MANLMTVTKIKTIKLLVEPSFDFLQNIHVVPLKITHHTVHVNVIVPNSLSHFLIPSCSLSLRPLSTPPPHLFLFLSSPPLSLSLSLSLSKVEVDIAGVPVYSNSSKPGSTHLPRPLCRKCGSGGLMELVRCRVCCHPFHRFCVGVQELSSVPFTCPQCITCSICGLGRNVSLYIERVDSALLQHSIVTQLWQSFLQNFPRCTGKVWLGGVISHIKAFRLYLLSDQRELLIKGPKN